MSKPYNRQDRFYKQAKSEGYRSRAAFKLIELNSKYKLLKPGMAVFDLGAWPGGWLQVTTGIVGESGLVVGVDLVEIAPLPDPNVHLIVGDAREESVISQALALNNGARFDLLVSDMSPKLTGIREADQAACVGCAELAVYVAQTTLRVGGDLVIKVFKGNEIDQFVQQIRKRFKKVIRSKLDSTRTTSNESYLICQGWIA